MSTPSFLRPLGLLMAMTSLVNGVEPAPKCSKIAQDVAESVALGADSLYADERCVENLALTARGLFTPFNATHVSIRTSDTSSTLYNAPSQAYRTLSYHLQCNSTTSAYNIVP